MTLDANDPGLLAINKIKAEKQKPLDLTTFFSIGAARNEVAARINQLRHFGNSKRSTKAGKLCLRKALILETMLKDLLG